MGAVLGLGHAHKDDPSKAVAEKGAPPVLVGPDIYSIAISVGLCARAAIPHQNQQVFCTKQC